MGRSGEEAGGPGVRGPLLGSEQKGARDGEQGGRLTRSGRCQGRRPSSDVVLASAFAASPAFRAALRAGLRQCGVDISIDVADVGKDSFTLKPEKGENCNASCCQYNAFWRKNLSKIICM